MEAHFFRPLSEGPKLTRNVSIRPNYDLVTAIRAYHYGTLKEFTERALQHSFLSFWVEGVEHQAHVAYIVTDGDGTSEAAYFFMRGTPPDGFTEPLLYACIMLQGGAIATVQSVVGTDGHISGQAELAAVFKGK